MVILQALVTALLSGVFSGVILFGLNERRDRADARLKKVEEAIEAHHVWYSAALTYVEAFWAFGLVSKRDDAERELKIADANLQVAAAKAGMLRGIYLPEASEAALIIMRALNDFILPAKDIRTAALDGKLFDNERYKPISVALLAIVGSIPKSNQMYDVARNIANRPHILRRYSLPKLR